MKSKFGQMVFKIVGWVFIFGIAYINMTNMFDRVDNLETENRRLHAEIRSLNMALNRLRDIAPIAKDAEIK